jgi:agmatine deiminase
MVKFIDEDILLVNDYSHESLSWKTKYEKALKNTGLNIELLPSVYHNEKNEHGDYTAKGCYINFAKIGDIILFPQFDIDEDVEAIKTVEWLFKNSKIIGVDSNKIAYWGGVLNCITWNISDFMKN